jgi:hypothetical protein
MIKKIIAVAVIGIVAGFAGSLWAQAPVDDVSTNIIGFKVSNSTNLIDVAPVPSGVVAQYVRIKVLGAGSITYVGNSTAYGTTNATAGGGTATNSFYVGQAAAMTFSNGDGWVKISEFPLRDGGTHSAFVQPTFGGTAVSGLVTGTVNVVTNLYWIQGRSNPSGFPAGGIGH